MVANSYRIFITKSAKAAELISNALSDDGDNVSAVKHGAAAHFAEIPNIYRDFGLFCAIAEYHDGKGRYKLTIC